MLVSVTERAAAQRSTKSPRTKLAEIRRYIAARGWTAEDFVDRGISGAKDRRPALDRLLIDARRRRFDVVVVWRLDRLGRNLRHLITLLEELQALGVAFVSLNEGIDATTPAGKLQMPILGAIAECERARIAERVKAGLQRSRARGKRLGSASMSARAIACCALWRVSGCSAKRKASASPSLRFPISCGPMPDPACGT